jgi:bile acid-coenzyme A ligase
MAPVSFPRRLADLAAADPDRAAVTCAGERLTRRQLEEAGTLLARDLSSRGVQLGDMVTIALPNSVDWIVAVVAAWKLGAIPQPVSARLPAPELAAIVELAQPKVILGVEPGTVGGAECLPLGYRPPSEVDGSPLPDAVSPAWKAPTSGGSTGRPKLIVSGERALIDPDVNPTHLIRRDGCTVVPGPLYHNGPAIMTCQSLLAGAHVALLPRFDAEGTLAAIQAHRAEVVYLVPTMMKRIIRLPDDVRLAYDVTSVQAVWHVAEPCPPWLKEVWIDWLGPDRIFEIYAGTEGQAVTVISGTEWLAHRGSVGRAVIGEIMIADLDGTPVPHGVTGEVWMRAGTAEPTYHYIGASPRTLPGGWESLGDLGWFDEDGYLYLADRMQDMILVGGANVYPAEIEAALQEHPQVRSCAVIGLPDEDKGNRVHAIVEADPASVDEGDLLAFLAERLARYKLPRTIELVAEPLRDEAGKVRRSALRSQRLAEPGGDR